MRWGKSGDERERGDGWVGRGIDLPKELKQIELYPARLLSACHNMRGTGMQDGANSRVGTRLIRLVAKKVLIFEE